MAAGAVRTEARVRAVDPGDLDGDPGLDALGVPTRPLAAVDVSRPQPETVVRRAAAVAARSAQLLVGVAAGAPHPSLAPLLPELVCTLVGGPGPHPAACVPFHDPEAALAGLAAAVAVAPRAATTLGRLLRLTAALPVPDALVAESLAYSMLLAGPEFAAWRTTRPQRDTAPPDEPPLLTERRGDILTVTLDRPARHNAYGTALRDLLVEALELAEADPTVLRVELSGRGPTFCSGGDLDEFGTAPDVAAAHLVRLERSAGALLHRLAPRVHAVVHGTCIGAGVELPAFAGEVLARPGTTFRLPELAMGLVPGAGGTVSLPRRIGRWRTAWLALSGQPVDLATALEWGLVDGRVG
jgi:hypothetical protein